MDARVKDVFILKFNTTHTDARPYSFPETGLNEALYHLSNTSSDLTIQ